jgi:xylulose-5-phosphate/fructose-6-phosphate phosphoketolase
MSTEILGPAERDRLGALFEVSDRAFEGEIEPGDDHLAPDGRVLEILSEQISQGWLEGYLLTAHGWRQDHNGFSHQDPGYLDHVVDKKAEIIPTLEVLAAVELLAGHAPKLEIRDWRWGHE